MLSDFDSLPFRIGSTLFFFGGLKSFHVMISLPNKNVKLNLSLWASSYTIGMGSMISGGIGPTLYDSEELCKNIPMKQVANWYSLIVPGIRPIFPWYRTLLQKEMMPSWVFGSGLHARAGGGGGVLVKGLGTHCKTALRSCGCELDQGQNRGAVTNTNALKYEAVNGNFQNMGMPMEL